MKFSNETIDVLKNFASINQGILFRKGKTLRTVSVGKNVMAEATIQEDIPEEFGIYDLNNFLSVINLYKDGSDIQFQEKNVVISGYNGRSKIKYRFCSPQAIVVASDKPIAVPDPEITFEFKAEDYEWIMKSATVLGCSHLAIESDGEKIFVKSFDPADDAISTDTLDLETKESGKKYKMIFKLENIKLIPGSYTVQISSKGIAHFKNKTADIQYWIATEAGSNYEKV